MFSMVPVAGAAKAARQRSGYHGSVEEYEVSDQPSEGGAVAPEILLTTKYRPGKHILIVDDDDWIRDVLVRVLDRHHYRVTSAASAEEALELLGQSSFDLLISDIMMKGMSGIELLPHVKATHPELPIVLITAHSDSATMRQAFTCGATDFIPKPFNFETIPFIIERSLERHAQERERDREKEEEVMWTTVQALATAMDAKEPFTAQHSRRVALLAVALAEEMGLPLAERRFVDLAAQVHDVGKIGTPDYILNKPGPLDDAEKELIRKHAEKGAEIVGRVAQLSYVALVVRHHHEFMDGNGYPDGIAGEDIPLLSRIIAVADAYEVMTSDRVYRSHLSKDEAIRRLEEAAGTQFDPQVLQALERLYPDSLPI